MNSIEHQNSGRNWGGTVWTGWLAAAFLALGLLALTSTGASAETRSLKLYFLHTGEKADITYKRNGSYDQAGLKKINNILRDWRRNEPTKMDPRLLDLIWEAYKASGSKGYIHVVCGYRAPATNTMLRSRSKGVAEKSQHMLGKAMDFYIPDVKLKTLRDIGLKMQTGGVGYYPRSGSPFVHFDVGSVRHWPRMSRKELVAVFPNGKTLHVPSDGKPLPGYETALASYQARKKSGGTALALASAKPSRSGGLLSALFGGGADEEEDIADSAPAKVKAVKAAPAEASEPLPGVGQAAAPVPAAPVEVEKPQTPEAIIAAMPARDIPLPNFAPRPKVDVGPATVPFGMADATATGDTVMAAASVAEAVPVEEDVAANVPLPTWRPDFATPASAAQAPVILAMATPADVSGPLTGGIPTPPAQPAEQAFTVAGIPAAQSRSDEIAAAVESNNRRLAMLGKATTLRQAVSALPEGADPAAFVGGGVKTTGKSARPSAQDTKPDRKPVVVAAQPNAARWALGSGDASSGGIDYVATVAGQAGTAPVARHIVRIVPSEVYATGFQQGALVADAGRFTGKAVRFLPVARFATN